MLLNIIGTVMAVILNSLTFLSGLWIENVRLPLSAKDTYSFVVLVDL